MTLTPINVIVGKKNIKWITGPEDFTTSVTPSCVHRVVARSAENLISLGAKLLVDQRQAALVAQETGLVPVAILVRQILQTGRS